MYLQLYKVCEYTMYKQQRKKNSTEIVQKSKIVMLFFNYSNCRAVTLVV